MGSPVSAGQSYPPPVAASLKFLGCGRISPPTGAEQDMVRRMFYEDVKETESLPCNRT